MDDDLLDAAEAKWAPPSHPVFQLVPPTFQELIEEQYRVLGYPAVSYETFWTVYQALRAKLSELALSLVIRAQWEAESQVGFEEEVVLMEGLQELRLGGKVVGADGAIYRRAEVHDDEDLRVYAVFSDEESVSDNGSDSEREVCKYITTFTSDESEAEYVAVFSEDE